MRADATFTSSQFGTGLFWLPFVASWRCHALLLSLPLGADVNIDDNLAVANAARIEDAAADASIISVGVLVVQVDDLAHTYLRQDLGTVVAREQRDVDRGTLEILERATVVEHGVCSAWTT